MFLPVGFVVKDFVVDLATISSVGTTTLIAGLWLVVDGVVGGTTLYCVVERRVGVGQVWQGVDHELGWEMDGRAKEGD